jgi:hypothetical protein
MGDTAFNALTGNDMLQEMVPAFGLKGAQGALKIQQAKAGIIQAAKFVMNLRPWSFRSVSDLVLVTVAGQNWIQLPADVDSYDVGEGLIIQGQGPDNKIVEVDEDGWAREVALVQGSGFPRKFYVGNLRMTATNTTASPTPAVTNQAQTWKTGPVLQRSLWLSPTPGAAMNIVGFTYKRKFLGIDFSPVTAQTGTPVFPDDKFDILWRAKCVQILSMNPLFGVEANFKPLAKEDWNETVEALESVWAVDELNAEKDVTDVYRDTDDLGSGTWGMIG